MSSKKRAQKEHRRVVRAQRKIQKFYDKKKQNQTPEAGTILRDDKNQSGSETSLDFNAE